MKKLLAIILTLMLMIACLSGCDIEIEIEENKSKYDGITKTNNINIDFWTDEETGVQYVIYNRNGGKAGMGGITPRLNSDGSIYVVD